MGAKFIRLNGRAYDLFATADYAITNLLPAYKDEAEIALVLSNRHIQGGLTFKRTVDENGDIYYVGYGYEGRVCRPALKELFGYLPRRLYLKFI